jgi:hypothetical protein
VHNQSMHADNICLLLPFLFMRPEQVGTMPDGARRTLLPRSAVQGVVQLFQVSFLQYVPRVLEDTHPPPEWVTCVMCIRGRL